MTDVLFENLTEEDLPTILEIYNYYVLNTSATFHIKALSLSEMRDITFFDNPRYKTFVIFEQDQLCGYVILHQFRIRSAYDESGEISIYLNPDYRSRGLGNLALQYIETVARTQEFHVLVATICGENIKSIQVFQNNGYVKCAHFSEIGKKFGQRLDSISYQKILE